MRIYKLSSFSDWARKNHIRDNDLQSVLSELKKGLLGDRLGSDIYKKRLAINSRGKSSGGRLILIFKADLLVIFIYGFKKNEADNLTNTELKQLKLYAKQIISMYFKNKNELLLNPELIEI